MASSFKDHFSSAADDYARFRPVYPTALFRALAELLGPDQRRLAWDCATGNGQAARSLAPYFQRVLASDASADQIRNAAPCEGVEYRVFPAEAPELEDGSADLITVAQALHWFNLEEFYAALRRKARAPHAVFAAWGYGIQSIGADLDPLLFHFYNEIVGPYWPPERALIEENYRSLAFPFAEFEPPGLQGLAMQASMNLGQFLGYLGTWSAVSRYRAERGEDPRERIASELAARWGDPETPRTVGWKLFARIGRVFGE